MLSISVSKVVVDHYIVLILFSSFILFHDDIGSTLPMLLVIYCIMYAHNQDPAFVIKQLQLNAVFIFELDTRE